MGRRDRYWERQVALKGGAAPPEVLGRWTGEVRVGLERRGRRTTEEVGGDRGIGGELPKDGLPVGQTIDGVREIGGRSQFKRSFARGGDHRPTILRAPGGAMSQLLPGGRTLARIAATLPNTATAATPTPMAGHHRRQDVGTPTGPELVVRHRLAVERRRSFAYLTVGGSTLLPIILEPGPGEASSPVDHWRGSERHPWLHLDRL